MVGRRKAKGLNCSLPRVGNTLGNIRMTSSMALESYTSQNLLCILANLLTTRGLAKERKHLGKAVRC